MNHHVQIMNEFLEPYLKVNCDNKWAHSIIKWLLQIYLQEWNKFDLEYTSYNNNKNKQENS